MIDFVCNNTDYDKTYLVTYSMSSAIVLATMSARPEYNDKTIVSYHLAPFVAFTNIRSILLRVGVRFGQFYLVSSPIARLSRYTRVFETVSFLYPVAYICSHDFQRVFGSVSGDGGVIR